MYYKITEKSSEAFRKWEDFKSWNSRVVNCERNTNYYLWDNLIARFSKDSWQLCLWDCGRRTKTTKERLNWILEAFKCGYIYQDRGIWYYKSRKWAINQWTWFQEIDVFFN